MPRGYPRPTALKLLANEQKSKINDDEPQPDEGIPACPSASIQVKKVWDYTVQQLDRMGVLTMVDRDLLHAYCVAVVAHRQASHAIAEEGAIRYVDGVPHRHPAFNMVKETSMLMKTLGVQFGLSPASRSSIRVGDSQKKGQEAGAARLLTG